MGVSSPLCRVLVTSPAPWQRLLSIPVPKFALLHWFSSEVDSPLCGTTAYEAARPEAPRPGSAGGLRDKDDFSRARFLERPRIPAAQHVADGQSRIGKHGPDMF